MYFPDNYHKWRDLDLSSLEDIKKNTKKELLMLRIRGILSCFILFSFPFFITALDPEDKELASYDVANPYVLSILDAFNNHGDADYFRLRVTSEDGSVTKELPRKMNERDIEQVGSYLNRLNLAESEIDIVLYDADMLFLKMMVIISIVPALLLSHALAMHQLKTADLSLLESLIEMSSH